MLQIHYEASSILYSENEAEVVITSYAHGRNAPFYWRGSHVQRSVKVLSQHVVSNQACCARGNLLHTIRSFPKHLSKFWNVKIDLRLVLNDTTAHDRARDIAVSANQLLYKLVLSLVQSTNLRKVTFQVSTRAFPQQLHPTDNVTGHWTRHARPKSFR